LALLRHHYRGDWEWTEEQLADAADTLDQWRDAVALGAGAPAGPVVAAVLAALADDLDAPRAVAVVQDWADATLGRDGLADTTDSGAGGTVLALVDAALGLAL